MSERVLNSQTSTIQDDVVVVDEQQIAYVPIEQIQEGDTVVSRDEQTGKTLYKRVAQTFSRTSDHLITLALADSKTGNVVETIQTTRNHPFYVDSKGWIPAGGLAIGNSIVTRAGPTLVIKNIEWERRAEGYKVYNFEVEDTHSYFVGTATGGAWVHNYNGLDFPLLDLEQAAKAASLGGSQNIRVSSRAEAEALRQQIISTGEYINTTGFTGNQVRSLLPNGKAGTFHWDYGDTMHGGVPHVQIHSPKGKIIRVFFTEGGGIPISPFGGPMKAP